MKAFNRIITIELIKDFSHFFRYFIVCITVFLLKIILTETFISLNLKGAISYVITHFLIFFSSYLFHIQYTFKKNYSKVSLLKYAKTVAVFKFMDYLIFLLFFLLLKSEASFAIFVASIAIFLIRFLALSKIFIKK